MIVLDSVVKTSTKGKKKSDVLSLVNLMIPTNRAIALLGPSDEDKRKLIEVLAGVALVNSGRVIRNAKVSFPVGAIPAFDKKLTIRANVGHVAQLYGLDAGLIIEFVRRVIDIGPRFEGRVEMLSPIEQKALMQIISLSIPFDTYLLLGHKIEPLKGCRELFEARQRTAGMIIPIKDSNFAIENCDMALVLFNGRLELLDSVEEGLSILSALTKKVKN